MMKKILGSALALAMTASVASAGYTPGPLDPNVFGDTNSGTGASNPGRRGSAPKSGTTLAASRSMHQ